MIQPEIIAELNAWGQRFWQRGWLPAGAGNFSLRLAANRYLVTASGRHKGRLSAGDYLVVDAGGQPLQGPGRPSDETALHLERYAADPGIGCVLHTHSPEATVLSRRSGDRLRLAGFELAKAFPGIDSLELAVELPVFDNDQNIARLAREVAARERREPLRAGYLIRGHGLYAWGPDVETAARRVEALEFMLRCAWMELS